MIARRLRDKEARGEPITIENFVIDTIKGKSVRENPEYVLACGSEMADVRAEYVIKDTLYSLL